MCGICGYVSRKRIEDSILCVMRDSMTHRGPNDAGIWNRDYPNGYIGLAHRRLSIFDLTELGHQPMESTDGRYTIAYNGEVYNFKDLRNVLISKGYKFKSECDTEVILYAYDYWKEKCFERFNGMFAIAIWDSVDEKLILARDRMGVKPLYYYWCTTTEDFVFGSELKPIMLYPGFKRNVRHDALGKFLCNKYIAAPDAIFENTYKVVPGTYVVFHDNTINTETYWNFYDEKNDGLRKQISDFKVAKSEINELLVDAVNKRMVADVPVGTFLSSGVDSALVTAVAQRYSEAKVKTFTIGFYEKERNEADRAKKIADYLGTEHTELYVGDKEILELISDITDYYDEPFSDSSQLPTMLVSKLASNRVTVALSGDGGDELFCGYKMYDWSYIAQKADFIGNVLRFIPGSDIFKQNVSPELRAFINNRDAGLKTQLFVDVMTELASSLLLNKEVFCPKFDYEKKMDYRNWQERRMLLDMMTYLPDEVMAKTDRASMKYSLEVRSPLLDYRLVKKAFEIPQIFKYYNHDKKHILKEVAYDYIPKELLSGPKKGFGVPMAKWLRGPLKGEIKMYSDKEFIRKQGIFDQEGINRLIARQSVSDKVMYSSMLWSFYMFQRWWEQYVS